jgi:hypothetical protein
MLTPLTRSCRQQFLFRDEVLLRLPACRPTEIRQQSQSRQDEIWNNCNDCQLLFKILNLYWGAR